MSQWQLRPLKPQQLFYAAADTYVLLPLLCSILSQKEAGSSKNTDGSSRPSFDVSESCRSDHAYIESFLRTIDLGSLASLADEEVGQYVQSPHLCPLPYARVHQALVEGGFDYPELITEEEAPEAIVVKSLAIRVTSLAAAGGHELVICLLTLAQKLSLDKCADHLGVNRSDVDMLDIEELIPICGYPRGGIGPLGLRSHATHILIDETLMSPLTTSGNQGLTHCNISILCGAGKPGLHFKTSPEELVRKVPGGRAIGASIAAAGTKGF